MPVEIEMGPAMTKPRVFIGASRENQDVAEAIQQSLDHASEVEIWDQGTFGASQYPLESLELKLDVADFAIFVFSPDDVTMMRGQEKNTVRDNVVFELGLFIGRLSRKRTFIISPRNAALHLPSDLAGLTPLDYEPGRADGNLRASVSPACTSIRTAFKEHGPLPRPSRELAAQESTAAPKDDGALSPDFYEPAETWSEDQYAHVYFVAVFLEREAEAIKVDTAFRVSSFAQNPEKIAEWEARCDWVHISRGENRSIKRFRNRVQTHPNNPRLRDFLGRVLSHYGNNTEATKEFLLAAKVSTDPALTTQIIGRALGASESIETQSDLEMYRSMLLVAGGFDPSQSTDVLATMKTLAEKEGLETVSRAMDELRLRSAPDDTALRFEVALQNSEEKQSALSMHHYKKIPSQERNGTVWNNLGVTFANLGMPGKAVDAYLIASGKGETIADGNLARKLAAAGFLQEAKARAEAAVKIEDHHENVVAALAEIQTARQEEAAKEDEAALAARLEQEYLLNLGDAGLSFTQPDISGYWETPDGIIEFRRNTEGLWVGKGEVEKEAPIGLGLMFSPNGGKQTTDIEYTMKRFGNALEGTVARDTRGYRPGLLGIGLGDRKVSARISEDGNSLTVREVAYDTTSSIWARMQSISRSPLIDGSEIREAK